MKEKRFDYIAPVCEVSRMTMRCNVMLTLSVSDEETEIVGAKQWLDEDGDTKGDAYKHRNLWED